MTTKVPVELSSTPSIVDNGDATAITIDSSERVGINTSSPAKKLHITDTSGNHIRVAYSDGYYWDVGRQSADGRLSFTDVTGGETLALRTGGGITFNGDTAAANALDDYEEGTWTPATTSGVGITNYSSTYTKIGDVVMYRCYFIFGATSSGDSAVITGLPFTNVGSNVWCAGSIWENNAKQPYPLVQDGGESTIQLRKSANGAYHPYSDFSNTHIILTGTYKTTQ